MATHQQLNALVIKGAIAHLQILAELDGFVSDDSGVELSAWACLLQHVAFCATGQSKWEDLLPGGKDRETIAECEGLTELPQEIRDAFMLNEEQLCSEGFC